MSSTSLTDMAPIFFQSDQKPHLYVFWPDRQSIHIIILLQRVAKDFQLPVEILLCNLPRMA